MQVQTPGSRREVVITVRPDQRGKRPVELRFASRQEIRLLIAALMADIDILPDDPWDMADTIPLISMPESWLRFGALAARQDATIYCRATATDNAGRLRECEREDDGHAAHQNAGDGVTTGRFIWEGEPDAAAVLAASIDSGVPVIVYDDTWVKAAGDGATPECGLPVWGDEDRPCAEAAGHGPLVCCPGGASRDEVRERMLADLRSRPGYPHGGGRYQVAAQRAMDEQQVDAALAGDGATPERHTTWMACGDSLEDDQPRKPGSPAECPRHGQTYFISEAQWMARVPPEEGGEPDEPMPLSYVPLRRRERRSWGDVDATGGEWGPVVPAGSAS